MAATSSSTTPAPVTKLSLVDFLPTTDSKQNIPPGDPNYLSQGQAKQWRVDVWEETKKVLEAGYYMPFRGQPNNKIQLPPLDLQMNICSLQTLMKKQQQQQTTDSKNNNNNNNTVKSSVKVSCYRGDCLDAARVCYVKYNGTDQPFVMNAASHKRPGGGYQSGSRAQEEEMCRRTSLAFQIDSSHKRQHLNPYPLPNGTGHYENNVACFRGGPNSNYAFLPKPFFVRFGAVAAPVQPALSSDGQTMLQEGTDKMTNSLRLFFRMAAASGSKCVVPIALGAGAFRCPANHVAKLTMQMILEECIGTSIEEVMIAIFDDHNALRAGNPDGNFLPFARAALGTFGSENVEVMDEDGTDLKASILGGVGAAAKSNNSGSSKAQQQQQNKKS